MHFRYHSLDFQRGPSSFSKWTVQDIDRLITSIWFMALLQATTPKIDHPTTMHSKQTKKLPKVMNFEKFRKNFEIQKMCKIEYLNKNFVWSIVSKWPYCITISTCLTPSMTDSMTDLIDNPISEHLFKNAFTKISINIIA